MADCCSLPNAAELVEQLRSASELGDAPAFNEFGVIVSKSTAQQSANAIEALLAENAKLRSERDAAVGALAAEFGTNLDDCKTEKKCGNCDKTDGAIYTSNPPQVLCTITGEFHHFGDSCTATVKEKEMNNVCHQCCPYNTLDGCKKDELNNGVCVLSNFSAEISPRTDSKWISVEDRLPSENDRILVNIYYPETPYYLPEAENEVTIAYYTTYDNLFVTLDNEAYNADLSKCDIKNHQYVSHWMPLPEPPKEEE